MKAEPVAAGRIEREVLETWDSVFDMIAKRGIALRDSAATWSSGFLAIVVLGMAVLWFAQGQSIFLALIVGVLGAGLLVRTISAAEEGAVAIHDEGIDMRSEGRDVRVRWAGLEREESWFNERFRGSNGQVFSLPGDRNTRDAALSIVRWCAEVRGDIAGADGSLLRAIDEMAAAGRLRFRFDRGRAFTEIAVAAALALLFGGLAFVRWSDRGMSGDFLVLCAITVAAVVWLMWSLSSLSADLGTEISVSDRGLSKSKDGKAIATLSWLEVAQPSALKARWEGRLLGSSADGRVKIDGSKMVHARPLEAIVDHLLVRELARRDLRRTLKPSDVRREPVPNYD